MVGHGHARVGGAVPGPWALPSRGDTAQTTLDQMRPHDSSAHENEFLEFVFSFALVEGTEQKDPE